MKTRLGELYNRYSSLVYSIAINATGDQSVAEEVTQDVFFRIWKNAASYHPENGKVVTWMARITRNRSIDEIRRLNIRSEANIVSWEKEEIYLWKDTMDVEEKVELSQRRNRVRLSISKLPNDQR